MSNSGDMADAAPTIQAIKAGFVRVLSDRIRSTTDPREIRELVYQVARIRLVEQFTHEDAGQAREIIQTLEQAIQEVERDATLATSSTTPPALDTPKLPFPMRGKQDGPLATARHRLTGIGLPPSIARLAAVFLLVAIVGAAVAFWPRIRAQFAASPQPPAAAAQLRPPPAPESKPAGQPPATEREAPQAPQPSMPLPTTFGVYALSDGQLQELKAVPGKVPDHRVAISAAITTPSATTLGSGDVKFIVFRPDGGGDASETEVRVVARVSRTMGVDATGKAAMMKSGDAWVIRSTSFPYKAGPIEDQSRMLLLQPDQDGFELTPGRYVVVVKGMGYDFTVAGTVTDPNQCVERVNATNGAFYSPCPNR